MSRFRTDEDFEKEKSRLLEIVVPHMLHPDLFPQPRLTLDEIAVLWAKDKDHVVTKMAICKAEQRVLAKLRAEFEKIGVHSVDDVLDTSRNREFGALRDEE